MPSAISGKTLSCSLACSFHHFVCHAKNSTTWCIFSVSRVTSSLHRSALAFDLAHSCCRSTRHISVSNVIIVIIYLQQSHPQRVHGTQHNSFVLQAKSKIIVMYSLPHHQLNKVPWCHLFKLKEMRLPVPIWIQCDESSTHRTEAICTSSHFTVEVVD